MAVPGTGRKAVLLTLTTLSGIGASTACRVLNMELVRRRPSKNPSVLTGCQSLPSFATGRGVVTKRAGLNLAGSGIPVSVFAHRKFMFDARTVSPNVSNLQNPSVLTGCQMTPR
jgi:hypothetical protein